MLIGSQSIENKGADKGSGTGLERRAVCSGPRAPLSTRNPECAGFQAASMVQM